MKNKTVIVTGGAKGIGKAIALKFASEGANIVLNYRSSSPDEVKSEIEDMGVKCLTVQADVSKADEAQRLVDEAINEFGGVDVLINNAGITKDTLLMRMSTEDFETVIDINLKGCFNMVKAVNKIMMKQRFLHHIRFILINFTTKRNNIKFHNLTPILFAIVLVLVKKLLLSQN